MCARPLIVCYLEMSALRHFDSGAFWNTKFDGRLALNNVEASWLAVQQLTVPPT